MADERRVAREGILAMEAEAVGDSARGLQLDELAIGDGVACGEGATWRPEEILSACEEITGPVRPAGSSETSTASATSSSSSGSSPREAAAAKSGVCTCGAAAAAEGLAAGAGERRGDGSGASTRPASASGSAGQLFSSDELSARAKRTSLRPATSGTTSSSRSASRNNAGRL